MNTRAVIVIAAVACAAVSAFLIWLIPTPLETFIVSGGRKLSDLSSDQVLQAEAVHQASASARYEYFQAASAMVGAVAGLFTTIAAVAAALYARNASAEARRTADLARDALVASDRAWINADLAQVENLTFAPDGTLSMSVNVRVQNIGKTPAMNVHTSVQLVLDHNKAPSAIKELARHQRVEDITNSRILLPGDGYLRPWGPSAHPCEQGMDADQDWYLPAVIGVVTYQTHPDMALRQTAFASFISLNDNDPSATGLISVSKHIEDTSIQITTCSGGFAD